MPKTKDYIEFSKSQIAALGGTSIDYGTVFLLTQGVGVWYILSNIIGATLGAISNFYLCRKWAFKADNEPLLQQSYKYAIVSLSSLCLNTTGLYLLTEWGNIHYMVSKIIVGVLIAVSFNFLLQKHFVFKQNE